MKRHWSGQQGAILVLTAFLLPFIIAFTGMAVDFGSAYVRRSQLQNTADAAALAGAYHLDDNKADDVVLQYLKTNLDPHFTTYSYQTGDDFPEKFETLNYHTDKQKDELDVTLRSSVEASFLKLFDINIIPVSATAKAKVSGEDNPSVPSDDMFNYAITIGEEAPYSDQFNSKDKAPLYFNADNITINGNIRTNGRISMDNSRVNTLTGKIYATKDVKEGQERFDIFWENGVKKVVDIEPNVWAIYDWTKYGVKEFFTFKDKDGNLFSNMEQKYPNDPTQQYVYHYVTSDDKIQYGDSINILPKNNAGISELLKTYHDMSPEDREKNHIYYNDDENQKGTSFKFNSWPGNPEKKYPNLTNDYKNYYRIIVVPGDLDMSFEDMPEPNKDEYFVFISLYGNITVPSGSSNLNGIIYAPNGKVTLHTPSRAFNGSVVAKQVKITGNDKTINWVNYLSNNSHSSGGGKKIVHLVK